jgi:hypothetical protein
LSFKLARELEENGKISPENLSLEYRIVKKESSQQTRLIIALVLAAVIVCATSRIASRESQRLFQPPDAYASTCIRYDPDPDRLYHRLWPGSAKSNTATYC